LVIFVLGLRRAEAARLSVADYDRQGSRLRIFGKGAGDQAVWMSVPPEVTTALDVWLCESRRIGCDGSSVDVDPSTPIFIALDRPGREALSPSGIYHIIRTLGDRVGVRLRPHGLRHAGVTIVLDENGGNVRMAQVFARHANPATTLIYDDQRQDLAGQASRLAVRRLLGE
jgi:integrase/recombinase XerC